MYYREKLPNELTAIIEKVPFVKSASMSIWVKNGSRFEQKEENGLSHFIEHIVFKGTKNRTQKQIAEEIDAIGGQIDAFTGREYTCFYAKVISEHLGKAIELLTDLILNPKFSKDDIENEKKVIIEEIRTYIDTPDDIVHDLFTTALWKKHPLGQPILGTEFAVSKFNKDQIEKFFKNQYTPKNIIIAIAGNVNVNKVLNLIRKFFGGWKNNSISYDGNVPFSEKQTKIINYRKLEQVHMCIGTWALPFCHEDRYVLYIINNILGGSTSSRLFQKARETKALVYSITSYFDAFKDTGFFVVYAATSPEKLNELSKIIKDEFDRIKKNYVTENELSRAKEQIKSSFLLSLESTTNRMIKLAKQEVYFKKQYSVNEILRDIMKVSKEDVKRASNEILKKELCVSSVGPVSEVNFPKF